MFIRKGIVSFYLTYIATKGAHTSEEVRECSYNVIETLGRKTRGKSKQNTKDFH